MRRVANRCSLLVVACWLPVGAAVLSAPAALGEPAVGACCALLHPVRGIAQDAIVFRAEGGDGLGVFLPDEGGTYSLHFYPGAGPNVVAVSCADVNDDGTTDVIVARGDGSTSALIVDARGDLLPPSPGAIVAASRATGSVMASMTPIGHDRPVAVITDLDGVGAPELAWVEGDGRVLAASGDQHDSPVEIARIPAGFPARFLVAGRFSESGSLGLAVVGRGPRPRLAIVGDRNSAQASGVPAEAREVLMPNATYTVYVNSYGYSPQTVTIAPFDSVSWIWNTTGTVTSGPVCPIADYQFCSPYGPPCDPPMFSNPGSPPYQHQFYSTGTYPYFDFFSCVNSGTVVVASAVPGGVPESSVRVNKLAGGDLRISWGASCSGAATNYVIFEGAIQSFYSHYDLDCGAGVRYSADITPWTGSTYYLVAPETSTAIGTLGRKKNGIEIPLLGGPYECPMPQTVTCH